ncbi:hypothetical protein MNBD_GAMMA05-1820 [hydrothermal vent metagenome]|uniref:Uncharacterized protein n=1 Tax=hydrothermal vent metagenome TaxID=652676 RepID=A0A3B0WHQ3_9ZZZZ
MKVIEQLAFQKKLAALIEGGKARIKHTGQIVELKRVSEHGISVVSFRTGGEYFISNKYLEPVYSVH